MDLPQSDANLRKGEIPMHVTFEWNDSYRLGNERVDEQHRKIIVLANAISVSDESSTVRSAIMELFRHTREHFSDEEDLMQRSGYPKFQEHRRLHEELIEELGRVTSEQSFETVASIREFKVFVYKWVVDHLLSQDRELIDYVREHPNLR